MISERALSEASCLRRARQTTRQNRARLSPAFDADALLHRSMNESMLGDNVAAESCMDFNICTKPNLHHIACLIQCTGHELFRHGSFQALSSDNQIGAL